MTLLDDVLDSERPGTAAPRRRRLVRPAAVAVFLGLVAAVIGATLLSGGDPQVSALPDDERADAAHEQPCDLLPIEEVEGLIGQRLDGADANGGVGYNQCLYRGVPGAPFAVVDVQVGSAASLRRSGVAESPVGAVAALRDRHGGRAEPIRVPGVGDEAWVIDTNQQTLWARQGALVVGVSVATDAAPDDLSAAESIAGEILRAVAGR